MTDTDPVDSSGTPSERTAHAGTSAPSGSQGRGRTVRPGSAPPSRRGFAVAFPKALARIIGMSVATRLGSFRSWPSEAVLIDEPLALAEERTARLRRIYANCLRDAWDGNQVFREAVARHGGIQLAHDKRVALAHPISMLMWGELAAWHVAAELAERLEDPDARMAASSQVFDEARHFYVLRDYLALLHVPVPKLDTYFAIGARRLLMTRDLTVKLFAMQIIAEGTAQAIFQFLAEAEIEPVLSELLPYIERDEARHVGLGVLHLPERLAALSPRQARRVSDRANGIGDLFGATQLRFAEHYATLGADPRELFRRADRMLLELTRKLGTVPGTDGELYLRGVGGWQRSAEDAPELDIVLPRGGAPRSFAARCFRRLVHFGARVLPA